MFQNECFFNCGYFFFGQELREKTVQLDNCQAQYTHIQQDLEVYMYAYLEQVYKVAFSNNHCKCFNLNASSIQSVREAQSEFGKT